ncbi:MAG TPA: DUF4384 domain-containing protein [Polyangiaceae bacterium]|nr:DUF4384 domain-containing protein [Polyangiaceae bacterium]
MNTPTRHASVLAAAITSTVFACGGRGASEPRSCDGAAREQLVCESEFSYDATKAGGGFSVLGTASANASHETTALRALDNSVERYAAASRRLCDEYNKCVLSKERYTTESAQLRAQLQRIGSAREDIARTPAPARGRAIAEAYEKLVVGDDPNGLSLDFTLEAKRPADADYRPVDSGVSLPTGARLAATLSTSKTAYVYFFTKTMGGKTEVVFPNKEIVQKNPLPAGVRLRIPEGTGSFVLDSRDVGTKERLFVVASVTPIEALEASVASGTSALNESLERVGSGAECTRGLTFKKGEPKAGCVRGRGLRVEANPSRTLTEPGDDMVTATFDYLHTK